MNNELLSPETCLVTDVVGRCNEEHLKYCDCQLELLLVEEDRLASSELEELRQSGDIEDKALVKHRVRLAKSAALSNVVEYCKKHNIVCPIETRLLSTIVERFKKLKGYDLEDPKVYLIIRSVLNHQLSAHRMQLYSNKQGIVHEQRDRDGNRFYVLNPVEDAKRRADESIVNAIEKLSKIVEGEKHRNVNENYTVIRFEDFMSKDVDEDIFESVDVKKEVSLKFDNVAPVNLV